MDNNEKVNELSVSEIEEASGGILSPSVHSEMPRKYKLEDPCSVDYGAPARKGREEYLRRPDAAVACDPMAENNKFIQKLKWNFMRFFK